LEAGSYPRSIDELASWRRSTGATAAGARLRFMQFVVLASISSSHPLASKLVFKGGNALLFFYGNLRSTLDLDFTAAVDFPDDRKRIEELLNVALRYPLNRFQVKARCQSIQRNPPGLDKTFPTYLAKVCYQLPGDRYYQNFDEGRKYAQVIELEISLNDVICETVSWKPDESSEPLLRCSLEDNLAEKLRALLQQPIRNRSRPQDVYDIASRVREFGGALDLAKISEFLLKKAQARNIQPRKSSFDESVRSRAAASYDIQIRAEAPNAFIPFEEAWPEVLSVVSRLAIPD